jgi:hypothetical protein
MEPVKKISISEQHDLIIGIWNQREVYFWNHGLPLNKLSNPRAWGKLIKISLLGTMA